MTSRFHGSLTAIRKHPSLQRFYSSSKPTDFCKPCYRMLYEKVFLQKIDLRYLTFIAVLGTYAEVKGRADDGSCLSCKLIVQTLRQNERLWRTLDSAHLVRVLHISRLAENVPLICHSKERKIAGGRFKQLRVNIGNVDVCELLYAHSPAGESMMFTDESDELADANLEDELDGITLADENVAKLEHVETPDDEEPQQTPVERLHRMSDSAGDNFGWFERLSTRRQLNFESIRFWIKNCQERHTAEFLHEFEDPDFDILLLDVQQGCLVPATTSSRYLAFSYRWGEKPRDEQLLTTLNNQAAFKCKGSLSRENKFVPQGIRDAMDLVEKIGERYLWVDRLCIEQDDKEVMAAHVDKMHLVFGRSLATIVVMSGDSADDGLPGVQPDSREPPCNFLRTRDLVMVCRHPGIEMQATGTPYEERAWTFQERLLSPRSIIFTGVEVFFLCGSGSYRETLNGSQRLFEVPHATTLTNSMTPRRESAVDPFDTTSQAWKDDAPEECYIYGNGEATEGCCDFLESPIDPFISFRERILQSPFANHVLRTVARGAKAVAMNPRIQEDYILGYFIAYRFLVRDYTHRKLTKSEDILRAFKGVSNVLEDLGKTDLVCGLPKNTIDLALLWSACDDPLGFRKREGTTRIDTKKNRFPTWSWPSAVGAVDFLVSQRWRASNDGVVALMDTLKQSESSLSFEDQAMFQWIFNFLLLAISKVGLGKDMSDEQPFRSEITILGVQDGTELLPINPNKDVSSFARCPSAPSGLVLHPPPLVEVLHIEAQVTTLHDLWEAGGNVLVTSTRSWRDSLTDLMHECIDLKAWNIGPDRILKYFSRATLQEWLEILPDRAVKDILDNTGFTYHELTREELDKHWVDLGIEDPSEITVVQLSRVRAFPPTTFYWQYYTKSLDRVLSVDLYRKWGLVGKPWVTTNVMLVKRSKADPRLVERICIGHVNQDHFLKAAPRHQYLCIG